MRHLSRLHLCGVVSTVAACLISSVGCAQTTRPAFESHFGADLQSWSPVSVTQSPDGSRTFLGGYVDEPVSLNLSHLGPHDYVRVSFDLLILLTWDGSGHAGYTIGGSTQVGPDFFNVAVENGPLLMTDTFSNIPADDSGFKSRTKFQSFPSPVPGDLVASQTGAISHNSLGYRYAAGPGFPMDAVYHVTLLVPHHADQMTMNFEALLRDPTKVPRLLLPEEFWGLDHVVVEALPDSAIDHPDAKKSEMLLDAAINSKEPTKAAAAYLALLGGGADTRRVLRAARDGGGVKWDEIDAQIDRLRSTDAATAAAASQRLAALGAVIEVPLRNAIRTAEASDGDTVDFVDAAQRLLDDALTTPLTDPAQRKAAVASRALEIIGSK